MILNLDFDNSFPTLWRHSARQLVLACGCFDILTLGHIQHLREARRLGTHLCVLVTADEFVGKGHGRPIFPETARTEVVDAIRFVDFTVLNRHPTAVKAIRWFAPDFYAKGKEYEGRLTLALEEEMKALESVGGKLVFVGGQEHHTTDVVMRIREGEG